MTQKSSLRQQTYSINPLIESVHNLNIPRKLYDVANPRLWMYFLQAEASTNYPHKTDGHTEAYSSLTEAIISTQEIMMMFLARVEVQSRSAVSRWCRSRLSAAGCRIWHTASIVLSLWISCRSCSTEGCASSLSFLSHGLASQPHVDGCMPYMIRNTSGVAARMIPSPRPGTLVSPFFSSLSISIFHLRANRRLTSNLFLHLVCSSRSASGHVRSMYSL